LFAVLVGFAKTFILPVSSGSFKAPFSVHVHGALAFSWVLLFFIQATLIRFRNYRLHIIVGSFGILIAIGTAVTMLPAGMFAVQKGIQGGEGDTAFSALLGTATSALMFLVLVFAAILNRNKPEVHKRLMLLATIIVLWPAWFRFRLYFPSVPRPDIWFGVVLADSFIILAWIRDKIRYGKIHPVLLYVGLLIILEHAIEIMLFDSVNWRILSKMVYHSLLPWY
ncbi:MAG TPA: hypothetical protein VGD26_11155, partial [Chitinophagaceae bacterium]